MHNIIPYSENAFDLYKEAVDKKDDGESKNRLVTAEKTVEALYKEFDEHFPDNSLRLIPSSRIKKPLRDDLFDMYGYEAAIVKKVKNWLEEHNPVTVYGVCQHCGIVPFDTMDHILPHQQYAEYSVHARNLIPCCTDCNRRKNEREILNLYVDLLPDVEYLFMDVKANGDTIDLSFRLDNSKGLVQPDLFRRIAAHYAKLDLFDRIKTVAMTRVSGFLTQIKRTYTKYGRQEVIDEINEDVEDLRQAYGYNYWEVAFQKGLVNSPVFWDYYEHGRLI